ncbi:MAG: DnaJ domain-containing protein [Pseudohongiellaceae bacterium]
MILNLIGLILLPLIAYGIVSSLARRFPFFQQHIRLMLVIVSILLVIIVLVMLGRLPIHFILAPIGFVFTFLLWLLPTIFRFLISMLPALWRLIPLWQIWKSRTPSSKQNNPEDWDLDQQNYETLNNDNKMTRQLALEILGLPDNADHDAIIEAHRKLMQKLHPDKDGSDYLAKRINQAKDFLLM